MSKVKYDTIIRELREDDSDFLNAVLTNDLSLTFDNELNLIIHNG